MTQQEQIDAYRKANPNAIWGWSFYNSDIRSLISTNYRSNGIRYVKGLDENGNETAFLEPANLPEQTALKISGGGLPCPTFCS